MTATGPAAGAATLEHLLGDPYDDTNALGHRAVLAADERDALPPGGEELLDRYGLSAEFVPVELGGRLGDVDALVRRVRPVFRRDAALGLGYGLTSFMAGLNVWLAGSAVQRKATAELLLGRGKIAVGYHELAHGNDITANGLTARPGAAGAVLRGRKEIINNAPRAAAAVVHAHTGDRPGGGGHSLLLLDLTTLDPARFRRLDRFRTLGLRGCLLGGLAFDDCPVDADTLLGEPGGGTSVALRSFQVSRCVTAGAGLGVLDAGLFAVLRFARRRRLYGRPLLALPHVRSTLAAAFADLLTADALVTTASRALHLLPGHAGRYAAVTKYLVPLMVEEAMDGLAVVLGARSYLRQGEYAGFGKHVRDLPPLGIGHAGGVSCQLTLLPQLARALRPSRDAAPGALFDTRAALPALDLTALRLLGPAGDPVLARLSGTALEPHLAALTADVAALPPAECGVAAGPAAFALTERYALLVAAAAVAGHPGPPGWAPLATRRLTDRLTGVPALPETGEELVAELVHRAEQGLGFCLDREPVRRTLAE